MCPYLYVITKKRPKIKVKITHISVSKFLVIRIFLNFPAIRKKNIFRKIKGKMKLDFAIKKSDVKKQPWILLSCGSIGNSIVSSFRNRNEKINK